MILLTRKKKNEGHMFVVFLSFFLSVYLKDVRAVGSWNVMIGLCWVGFSSDGL